MKIGVYQFGSTGCINNNLNTIIKAINKAADQNVRILVFHECALCGYPPLENRIKEINESDLNEALRKIADMAGICKLYVGVGTVRFECDKRFNSLILFDDRGRQAGHYDKTALWGWDSENFQRGKNIGILEVDDLKIGFRICFDIRFPESFRELYKNGVDLCFVSFSDTSIVDDEVRYNIIKSHLLTRAVENVMTVVSVNSISNFQTAPTAVFDHNGIVIKESNKNKEELLVYEFVKPSISFGMKGRIENNRYYMNGEIVT